MEYGSCGCGVTGVAVLFSAPGVTLLSLEILYLLGIGSILVNLVLFLIFFIPLWAVAARIAGRASSQLVSFGLTCLIYAGPAMIYSTFFWYNATHHEPRATIVLDLIFGFLYSKISTVTGIIALALAAASFAKAGVLRGTPIFRDTGKGKRS